MKKFITTIALVLTAAVHAGTNMNLQGLCTGVLQDGSGLSFSYYSDFDGRKDLSKAAIVFANEGLFTGKRYFSHGKDIYEFGKTRVVFKDSTGNTSGTFRSENGEKVPVQCQIRDYEYDIEG